VAEY